VFFSFPCKYIFDTFKADIEVQYEKCNAILFSDILNIIICGFSDENRLFLFQEHKG